MMSKLTKTDIATLVKMRGIGYSQSEIAKKLGVTQASIQYNLVRIKERAEKEGDDVLFWTLISPEIVRILFRK